MATAPAALDRPPRGRVAAIVRWLYWPLLVLAGAGVLVFADLAGLRQELRLPLALGWLAIVVGTEPWLPLRRGDDLRCDPQWTRDVGHFLAAILGEAACLVLAVAPALAVRAVLLGDSDGVWPSAWPYAAQCVLALMVADGLDYASHRLLHGVSWLWPMHALHHDVDRLHALKGTRVHFLNVVFRGTVVYVPILLAGAPVEMLFWYQGAIVVVQTVAHGNLDLAIPAACHRWIVTPPVHRDHHALATSLAPVNFGAVFTIWDRCFGTFRFPVETPPNVGLSGPERQPDTFVGQLAWPFRRWHAALARAAWRPAPRRARRRKSDESCRQVR